MNKERGSTVVLVALTIVVLMGFAALAIDGGYLYYRHTQLQDVADAAALAAGQDYFAGQAKIIDDAKEYVHQNGFTVAPSTDGHTAMITNPNNETGYMDVTFPGGNIKVFLNIPYNTFFGRLLGTNTSQIGVSATVGKSNLASFGTGLVPIGVEDSNFVPNQSYTLTYGPPSTTSPSTSYSGNFGFVNLDSYMPPDSSGDNKAGDTHFIDYLAGGYNGSTTFDMNGTLDTITGEKVGQVSKAIDDQIGKTVTVPLISTLVDATGVERVTIIGFAEFEITGYDSLNKVVMGIFKQKILDGPGTTSSASYAINTVKLIQ